LGERTTLDHGLLTVPRSSCRMVGFVLLTGGRNASSR
jgi:hypothetical protein